MNTLSIDQLKRAVAIKEQIVKLENELAAVLGGTATPEPDKPRGMSAAGRARIAAAQRARWAKAKGGEPTVSAKPAKRKAMSAASRAKIAAAAKARWTKAKAAGKKTL